jgi:acyl-CoA synthetase (NDP forming)
MKRPDIEQILHPKSIAVVGATNEMHRGATGFLACLLDIGYEGGLYPINPNISESLGLKAYPTLVDVPDRVDHVVAAVPARVAPLIVEDAVKKGVRSVHFFTSGFAEVATDEGDTLQKKMTETARGKVRILGPNCMGFYNPKAKVAFDQGQPAISGGVGFISQSGGLATAFVQNAVSEANFCSKVVSIGNSTDLKLTEFLEYLSGDDDTKVICMYIEGLGHDEGKDFLKILKQTAGKKPVLILKGGLTERGAEAAHSHTAAMAGASRMWPVLSRQYGVMMVDSIEEMHDFIKLHRLMPPPETEKTGLVAFGGGCSVTYSDVCTRHDIALPELADETKSVLSGFIASVGTMTLNPVDVSASGWQPGVLEKTVTAVGKDPNIGAVIVASQMVFLINMSRRLGFDPKKVLEEQAHGIGAAARAMGLPVLCNNPPAYEGLEAEEIRLHLKKELDKQGIPSYPSIERTVKAFKRYHDYHQFMKSEND